MEPAGQYELPDLPDELMLQRLLKQPIDAQGGNSSTGTLCMTKWLYHRHHNWP
jgi:hypothetical protein